jgi:predicted TIM-barrel fold metal-dependent hydrolase
MGFLPLGNSGPVDARLHSLYEWCESESVPITAHCSPANAVRGAETFAHPDRWRPVLHCHPDLRLNIAHVGGIEEDGWAGEAINLIADHLDGHVYADVGNHDVSGRGFGPFLRRLARAIQSTRDLAPRVTRRLAFGSDYWYLYMHPDPGCFLESYADAFTECFPDSVESFLGGAARAFLGFDVPHNANRRRVLQRVADLQNSPWGPFPDRPSFRRVMGLP